VATVRCTVTGCGSAQPVGGKCMAFVEGRYYIVAAVRLVVVVYPSFPSMTIPEFINYANANPGKVNMASAGSGSPNHMAGDVHEGRRLRPRAESHAQTQ
jgi:hypothetical protein